MANTTLPYLSNPAGLVYTQSGLGWFISRLDQDDKIVEIIGPIGQKEKAIQETVNHFPHIYVIEEIDGKFSIFYIESETNDKSIKIQDGIESVKEAQKTVICLLKTEKVKNNNNHDK